MGELNKMNSIYKERFRIYIKSKLLRTCGVFGVVRGASWVVRRASEISMVWLAERRGDRRVECRWGLSRDVRMASEVSTVWLAERRGDRGVECRWGIVDVVPVGEAVRRLAGLRR